MSCISVFGYQLVGTLLQDVIDFVGEVGELEKGRVRYVGTVVYISARHSRPTTPTPSEDFRHSSFKFGLF